jgi:hypothetical protein
LCYRRKLCFRDRREISSGTVDSSVSGRGDSSGTGDNYVSSKGDSVPFQEQDKAIFSDRR